MLRAAALLACRARQAPLVRFLGPFPACVRSITYGFPRSDVCAGHCAGRAGVCSSSSKRDQAGKQRGASKQQQLPGACVTHCLQHNPDGSLTTPGQEHPQQAQHQHEQGVSFGVTPTLTSAAHCLLARSVPCCLLQPDPPAFLTGMSGSIATQVWQVAAKENQLEKVQDELQQVGVVVSVCAGAASRGVPGLDSFCVGGLGPIIQDELQQLGGLRDRLSTPADRVMYCSMSTRQQGSRAQHSTTCAPGSRGAGHGAVCALGSRGCTDAGPGRSSRAGGLRRGTGAGEGAGGEELEGGEDCNTLSRGGCGAVSSRGLAAAGQLWFSSLLETRPVRPLGLKGC